MAKFARLGVNSITKKAELAQTASIKIPLPEGVTLQSDEALLIWDQFTRLRAVDDWREADLVLLAKVVLLEVDIRCYWVKLANSEPLIENDRKALVKNPLIGIIDTLQRQQLSIVRSLGIMQAGSRTQSANENGRDQARLRKVLNQNQDLIPGWNP